MQYRSFGGGVKVSVLGMGCGRVGSINNTVPMREIKATLEAAVEAGVTLFDTADIYGQGDSERTLRTLIARHPGRLFVVTKVGFVHGRLAGVLRFAKPLLWAVLRPQPATRGAVLQARAQTMSQNFSPQYLREAVDRSRRRLGVDRLDALMLHSPPHEILMSSETHELLSDLVQRQRVSHVGVSATLIRRGQSGSFNSGGHDASGSIGRRKGPVWNGTDRSVARARHGAVRARNPSQAGERSEC